MPYSAPFTPQAESGRTGRVAAGCVFWTKATTAEFSTVADCQRRSKTDPFPPSNPRSTPGQFSFVADTDDHATNPHRSRHQTYQRPPFSFRQRGQNRDRRSRSHSIDSMEPSRSAEDSTIAALKRSSVIANNKDSPVPVAAAIDVTLDRASSSSQPDVYARRDFVAASSRPTPSSSSPHVACIRKARDSSRCVIGLPAVGASTFAPGAIAA
jgi:alkanesulfonate monooxygenase SsuD/methylene tetrahydromethanopterin reductase-like flavin-dependent oxidoreductase (luciferase family)